MKKIKKWLRNQATAFALATSSVEREILTVKEDETESGSNIELRHKQGTLSDDLKQGRITQEVKFLRWRMYKVLQASEKFSAKITGYDEHGNPIVQNTLVGDNKFALNKVKLDSSDDYELEMVVDNTPITLDTINSMNDVMQIESTESEITEVTTDENTNEILITEVDKTNKVNSIGNITSDELNSSIKQEVPLQITRALRSKFEIEKYTKRLHVRKINEKERLLEFYISKYPDSYDKKTVLLIAEIKRAMVNPRASNMLEFENVEFVSYKTLGVSNYLQFKYLITSFDKIVEHDGFYIIKFKSDVIVNGFNILDKYKEMELEGRYERKEQKAKL